MKNSLCGLLFALPLFLAAQNEPATGIRFENLKDWNTVKAKAKKENKYIFIDFYATWCGPCKNMDKYVYPLDSVGDFVNSHFLPIKVQVDSSAGDNEQTKTWYAEARHLQSEYQIVSLPSFLIFNSDGKLIHKGMGFIQPPAFMSLVRYALDPQKQYYTLLETYRQGKLPSNRMAYLALTARSLNDGPVAREVADAYITNDLLKLSDNELYTAKNLRFMSAFLHSSKDKAFQLFYQNGARIDTTLQTKNFSRDLIDPLIEREEINAYIYKNGKPFESTTDKPDWTAFANTIKNKYNSDYADRIVLWAKIKWYENKKEWSEYAKNVILKVEKYGPYFKAFPSAVLPHHALLNACAWDIFLYSPDRHDLEVALAWSEKVIRNDSTHYAPYIDTYANILYKLGRTAEALPYEEKAFATATPAVLADEIGKNLTKMKKGEPTWSTE